MSKQVSTTSSSSLASLPPLEMAGKLGVLGVGVMGRTLIQGILESGLLPANKIWATAKSQRTCDQVGERLGIHATTHYLPLLAETDLLLLCVKPYQMPQVLKTLNEASLKPGMAMVSIVAGLTLSAMESSFTQPVSVIRAMPNTPCVVQEGMTVICGGTHASSTQLEVARQIFSSVGRCLELEEQYFNAVTGLSASGPAYFYLMMEALADGGVRVGLPRDVALQLVSQTALGAATMVQQTGLHPASLRDEVTTPAGCTIAALLTMEDGKIRSVLARAVEEATKTAKGLGSISD